MPSSLDRFRRSGFAPVEAPRHEPEVAAKVAEAEQHESGDDEKSPTRYRQHCLEIRPLKGFCTFPAYAQLIDFFVDHPENPSILIIWFMHVLVIVKGRNMKEHLAGLRQRTLWIIQQHERRPDNENALFVESIEFERINIPATVATLCGDGREPARR